jgi:ABC-2 type transport system ATP-binding protein
VAEPDQCDAAERALSRALDAPVHLESDPAALSIPVEDAERASEAVGELFAAGIAVSNFSLGQPSLDEVFLALTGHPAEEDEKIEEPAV